MTGGVTEAVLRKITQGTQSADMEELKSSGGADADVIGKDRLSMIIMAKREKHVIVRPAGKMQTQLLKKIKSGEIRFIS